MEATVNLATEKAKIVADDNISDQEIINLVEKRVMEPLLMTKLIRKKLHVKLQKSRNLALSFWIALILTLPLVVAMFADIFGVHCKIGSCFYMNQSYN